MIYIATLLLILGIIGLAAKVFLEDDGTKNIALVVGVLCIFGSGLSMLGASATSIQAGHVGVPVVFGEVQDYTYAEGFHFVNPFADVQEMSIQTQTLIMANDTALHVMSSDQLTMTLEVSVLYHLNAGQAPGVRRYMPDYQNTVVDPSVKTAIRDAVRQYDAVSAVSNGRDLLSHSMIELVKERIGNALAQRNLERFSIHIDDVQLRNIALPDEIRESIARVQRQRQEGNEREQSIRTAEQEAQRARAEAEGVRQVQLIEAHRDAESRLIRARAEAEAMKVLSDALTPELLRLRAIEATREVISSNGTRTVILGGSGSGQMPMMLNMGQ